MKTLLKRFTLFLLLLPFLPFAGVAVGLVMAFSIVLEVAKAIIEYLMDDPTMFL